MTKNRVRFVTSALLLTTIWYTVHKPPESGIVNLRAHPQSGELSKDEYLALKNLIVEHIQRTASVSVPDYLNVYYGYDVSGMSALIDLVSYLYTTRVPLPLFSPRDIASSLDGPKPKVCVSVVSARRPKAQFTYLLQTISALLNRMNYKKFKDFVYIHVFNVDQEPENHVEADIVKHLLPVTNLKVPIVSEDGFPVQTHYHENRDHAEILRRMSHMGCENPIVLADDALATMDWVESVMLAISQIETQHRGTDWFMVRLFTARSVYPLQRNRGLNDYDQEFSAVAILFNKKYITEFAEEMDNVVSRTIKAKNHALHVPRDHMAERFSRDHGLKVWSFEPIVFQHTGMYSSVSDRPVNRGTVSQWFMASKKFEADKVPITFNGALWP